MRALSTILTFAVWLMATPKARASGWVEGRLQSMTLREKLGQMIMVDIPGTEATPEVLQNLKSGAYGSVLFFERNAQEEGQTQILIRELQNQALVETGVPLLIAVDQEGGPVNRLGALLGLKGTQFSARTLGQVYAYDPLRAKSLVGTFTQRLAKKMRQLGFNMNLAPVLDLTDDKASYIYERSYGSDPETVSKIATQFADVMRANRIVTTGKHFPNLSVTHPDSHQELPVLGKSLAELEGHDLLPFANLRDHLGAVMVGHVVVPEIDPKFPASISVKAGRLLRRKIGWQGVVISDDLKMKALADHYTLPEIVLRAVFADTDILLMAAGPEKQHEVLSILETCVTRGKISMSRIDRSVRRILELKEAFSR